MTGSIRAIRVPPEAELPLSYALVRTMEDLEARAIASAHPGDLGHHSADDFRNDIAALRDLARRLGHEPRDPNAEGHVLVWLGQPHVITDGTPGRLVPAEPLERLLAQAEATNPGGHIPAEALVAALTHALRHTDGDLTTDPERGVPATQAPDQAADPASRPPPGARHRLAPGCEPPRPAARKHGRGGRGC